MHEYKNNTIWFLEKDIQIIKLKLTKKIETSKIF